MKTILIILFIVACLIYSSSPVINFKPFSISFETPTIPLAIILLSISIILFQKSGFDNGYSDGFKDGCEWIIDEIKKEINAKK